MHKLIIKYHVGNHLKLTEMEKPDSFCCDYMKKKFNDNYNLYAENQNNTLEHQCEECGIVPFKFCPNCGQQILIIDSFIHNKLKGTEK